MATAGRLVGIRQLHGLGRTAEAPKTRSEVNQVIPVLIAVGVYPGVKAALRLQGLDVGVCRKPFAPLTPDHEAALAGALERLG